MIEWAERIVYGGGGLIVTAFDYTEAARTFAMEIYL